MIEFDGILPFDGRYTLPESPGIYFVMSNEVIYYVGLSNNLNTRWKSTMHHRYTEICALDNPKIAWVEVPERHLKSKEAEFITRFNPPLNRRPVAPNRNGTIRINVSLTASMYEYLMDREARRMPASEYIRQLVATDMGGQGQPKDP